MQKSYNTQYLTGDRSYTDERFQADMRKRGIEIPNDLLYKPELNEYVAGKMKEENIKGYLGSDSVDNMTGLPYTPERAEAKAEKIYQETIKAISALY